MNKLALFALLALTLTMPAAFAEDDLGSRDVTSETRVNMATEPAVPVTTLTTIPSSRVVSHTSTTTHYTTDGVQVAPRIYRPYRTYTRVIEDTAPVVHTTVTTEPGVMSLEEEAALLANSIAIDPDPVIVPYGTRTVIIEE